MEINRQNTKKILGIIFISIAFYFVIQRFDVIINVASFLWEIVFVFVLGGAMAFVLNVPMKKIEKAIFNKNKKLVKLKRPVAYLVTIMLVIMVIFLVMFIVIPEIASTIQILSTQIHNLYLNIPGYIDELSKGIPQLEEYIALLQIDWSAMAQNAITTLQTALSGVVNSGTWFVVGLFSGVTTFIISFIFSIYILFSKEKIMAALKRILYAFIKEDVADKVVYVSQLSNKMFSSFLSGQCLEAVILGIIFFIVMSIFNMPYAILIGVVISVTALVPIFGAFIGCALGAFLIFMINPMQAVWFVVMFLIIQQIENNLIYPKVVGNSVGLPAILVFIAVIIGGNLMGIAGMLVFIPMCSVLYVLVNDIIATNLKNKGISKDKI